METAIRAFGLSPCSPPLLRSASSRPVPGVGPWRAEYEGRDGQPLPTDVVPLLARVQSLLLLAVTAVVTAAHARRFRIRHGLALFGGPER